MSTPPRTPRSTRPAGAVKALADALEITPRRVSQLLKEGLPLDPEAAIAWRKRNQGGRSVEALREERIKLVKAQRQKLEEEAAARRGDLIPAGEVLESCHRAYSAARDELLKFVHDLPPRLEGLSAPRIQRILHAEVMGVLRRLSDETNERYQVKPIPT
jgi:plasmid maintenance system antidote protein VapI